MCFISTTGPVLSGIDIPAIPMSIDFCVVFYDREAMGIAMESDAGTGNSFFFLNGQMVPAEIKATKTNETMKVNWQIRTIIGR